MEYRWKRRITNTLLHAVIIIAMMVIIKQYTLSGMIIFAIVSVFALAADIIVEFKHLKKRRG